MTTASQVVVEQPTPEQLDRLDAVMQERARIEAVWMADSWRYYDRELGIFAGVMLCETSDAPAGKSWRLYVARGEEVVGLPDETWYATADEAKEALSDAVLDTWLTKQATA